MFTDLDEFLDEYLGYKTRDHDQFIEMSKADAKKAAFFASRKKFREENIELYRALERVRYHKKKKDEAWRLKFNAYMREWRAKNKAKIRKYRERTDRLRKERLKTDPVYLERRRAIRRKSYKKRKLEKLLAAGKAKKDKLGRVVKIRQPFTKKAA